MKFLTSLLCFNLWVYLKQQNVLNRLKSVKQFMQQTALLHMAKIYINFHLTQFELIYFK